jgi:hypothetical protein
MNRQVTFVLAAIGFGLLVSGTPVAAQDDGNGTFGVDVCTGTTGIVNCPTVQGGVQVPNLLGACVSFANVCFDSGRTLTPQLFQSCCVKCVGFTDLCGLPHEFCADSNSGFPLNCDVQ